MHSTFIESARDMRGLTVRLERKALLWMAPRLPAWVHSDHLTVLAFLAMALAGTAYALSSSHPALLWVVNVLLVINWFGDSLDGTLARVRQRQRPRYGFYVDHVVDAAGAALLLGGLGIAGHMSPMVAVGLIAAYFLLSIEVYLATYCVGRFSMSAGGIGGTELRLLLIAMNAALFVTGPAPGVLNLVGVSAIVLLVAAFIRSAVSHTRELYDAERLPPQSDPRALPVR